MASFECIFAKTDTDEANNKVFHCVKVLEKMSFYLEMLNYIDILTYLEI